MDKAYSPQTTEQQTYELWEKAGAFTPSIDPSKKPFTILLPLPNANDPMHMGHALFTVQDIMIRYHRMLGDPTLWLPGGDHAGIETQFVFEKRLTKEGKSRFDFDRETLYTMISEFVDKNRTINRDQMKRLGFSLDWTRYHYSLEPEIVATVLSTFKKLHGDNLLYRASRLVNYCTRCGTAFSDLEINHDEKHDFLYTLDYGSIRIATARPETIFADVAVAVNPKDKRYKDLIGKEATIPLTGKKVPIIADDSIKIDFGTGALKVTPAHAQEDYEIGLRHKLPMPSCIDRFGRLINVPDEYAELKVLPAREKVVADLEAKGFLKKKEPLVHMVSVCYRCKNTIEPMLLPQWYVKTKPLAKPAIEAVKNGTTTIEPLPRFKKLYFDWMENILDWNISRQIVWGPRIPVWYCLDCTKTIEVTFLTKDKTKKFGTYETLSKEHSYEEIIAGLQSIVAPLEAKYSLIPGPCPLCHGTHIVQETDTFDTWFLSGQWPVTTLGYPNSADFSYFYPTSVLDTLWDILFFWVARMMMFGIYLTGKVPFEVIHLHSRVVDKFGQKMSKSKGNVVNPIEMVDKYGADALRMALVFGAAPGSDISLSEDKVRGMRNFANKLWNIGRLYELSVASAKEQIPAYSLDMHGTLSDPDKQMLSELSMLTASVTKAIATYRFSDAAQSLYEFVWHRFADVCVEENKDRYKSGDTQALAVFAHIYKTLLTLLHPFMPFATETIWQQLHFGEGMLMLRHWPGK